MVAFGWFVLCAITPSHYQCHCTTTRRRNVDATFVMLQKKAANPVPVPTDHFQSNSVSSSSGLSRARSSKAEFQTPPPVVSEVSPSHPHLSPAQSIVIFSLLLTHRQSNSNSSTTSPSPAPRTSSRTATCTSSLQALVNTPQHLHSPIFRNPSTATSPKQPGSGPTIPPPSTSTKTSASASASRPKYGTTPCPTRTSLQT